MGERSRSSLLLFKLLSPKRNDLKHNLLKIEGLNKTAIIILKFDSKVLVKVNAVSRQKGNHEFST